MKNEIIALDLSDSDISRVGIALTAIQSILNSTSSTSRLDSEILVSEVLQKDRAFLWAFPESILSGDQQAVLSSWVDRRLKGEPLAYLLGRKEFWGLPLSVNANVLIPRPDTETLVERALECLSSLSAEEGRLLVLDVGTGSGAISLALVQAVPSLICVASDISNLALSVARENVKRWGGGRCQLLRASWASCVADNSCHLLVSNPPYIKSCDPHLERGDVQFEPLLALDGGTTGLAAYDILIKEGLRVIKPGGFLILEHGYDQAEFLRQQLIDAGFCHVKTDLDIAKHERVTWGQKPQAGTTSE